MKFLKKYWLIIIVVLPVALLVMIRISGDNHFKPDSKKLAGASFDHANIIALDKIDSLNGDKLIIILGNGYADLTYSGVRVVNIPADSILSKKSQRIISDNEGPVMLRSSDKSIAAKIWMLLVQMGHKNIFILMTDEGLEENLKYKFRPDSLVKPEL